jgi:hypothetical protein
MPSFAHGDDRPARARRLRLPRRPRERSGVELRDHGDAKDVTRRGRRRTTYEQTRSIPTPSREALTITEFEPDRHIAVAGTLARFPARLDYRMDERDGRTRLSNTVDLDLTDPLRLLGGIATGRIRSAVAENLQALQRLLEAGGPG